MNYLQYVADNVFSYFCNPVTREILNSIPADKTAKLPAQQIINTRKSE